MVQRACKACSYLTVLLSLALLAACSSTPRPTDQVQSARAAVSQAQPLAALGGAPELGTAQAKLAGAEEAMQRGDYTRARILAEQAEVDARYAWTLGENARLQRAAAQIGQDVQQLRDEIERRTR